MNKQFLPLAICVFILAGCSVTKPIALDSVNTNVFSSISSQVNIGDHVHITTTQGEDIELVVDTVTKETITGDNTTIKLADIETIRVDNRDEFIQGFVTAYKAAFKWFGIYIIVGLLVL